MSSPDPWRRVDKSGGEPAWVGPIRPAPPAGNEETRRESRFSMELRRLDTSALGSQRSLYNGDNGRNETYELGSSAPLRNGLQRWGTRRATH